MQRRAERERIEAPAIYGIHASRLHTRERARYEFGSFYQCGLNVYKKENLRKSFFLILFFYIDVYFETRIKEVR